jgi:hypothetical protein
MNLNSQEIRLICTLITPHLPIPMPGSPNPPVSDSSIHDTSSRNRLINHPREIAAMTMKTDATETDAGLGVGVGVVVGWTLNVESS